MTRRFDAWRFLGFLICATSAGLVIAALWTAVAIVAALEVGR